MAKFYFRKKDYSKAREHFKESLELVISEQVAAHFCDVFYHDRETFFTFVVGITL
jgi:uncharacterized protein HemY